MMLPAVLRTFLATSMWSAGTCLTDVANAAPSLDAEQTAFFESRVRPLLAKHCYECHSQEGKMRGGLLLDSAGGWQTGGESGDVIRPGQPKESLLITAIRYADRDLQMPPRYRLEDDEIAVLESWVRMGAPDPRVEEAPVTESVVDVEAGRQFWAFQKPAEPPLPEIENSEWATHSLDRFVLAALEAQGLAPAPPADRTTLIRRVTFDLIGLPPTPAEIDAFLADPSGDREALAKVVDDLLSRGQFGERWGRHWLDVVRYAESMGRTRNFTFPYAWRYRDYVIDAFNDDLPFDQFVKEQVAGDLLEAADPAERDRRRVATGFLALGSHDLNERDREQYAMDVVDEQIDVTGRAFLGLTTGCARCHDHKFDPVTTQDYYALAGIFKSTETLTGYLNRQGGNQGGYDKALLLELPSVEPVVVAQESAQDDKAKRNRLRRNLTNFEKQKKNVERQLERAQGERIQRVEQRLAEIDKQIARIKRQLARLREKGENEVTPRLANHGMGVRDKTAPVNCRVNIRGEARNLGERVPRGFLEVLLPPGTEIDLPKDESGRRELAAWLASRENPLVARVFVNRVWQHLFGKGLVKTVDNFGKMGERPTHPALLDHLAVRFMEDGWSTKQLVRDFVSSSTYRMSSAFNAAAWEQDPENDLLWRMPVRRLEIEPLRDSLLAIGGNLDPRRPTGSPVMGLPMNQVRRLPDGGGVHELNCRSVYVPVLRDLVPGVFQVFDFAEPTQVMGRRDVTTVSTQALYFMNNPFVMEQAGKAAERLLGQPTDSSEIGDRLESAYRWALGRSPTSEERVQTEAFFTEGAFSSEKAAWSALFQALFASAEFRYVR